MLCANIMVSRICNEETIMKPRLLLALLGLATSLALGCSADISAHEHLGRNRVELSRKLAEEMENMLKNLGEESFKDHEQNVKKLGDELKTLNAKIQQLSQGVQSALDSKFKGELDQARTRIDRIGAQLRNKLPPS